MGKEYKLNLGLVTEDLNTTDFLYVWDKINVRPCRTNVYSEFDYSEFISVIEDFKLERISYVSEINGDENNIRYFYGNDSKSIYVSFLLVQEGENKNVFDVSFIHADVDVNDLIDSIKSISFGDLELGVDSESDIKINKTINTIISTAEGLKVIPYNPKEIDLDSIDDYYDDDVIKDYKKLLKNINSGNPGLYLISGDRGNGKTSLLNIISRKVKCDVIYFPVASFDILSTIDMTDFLETHKNKLFIFDDFDIMDNYRTISLSNSINNIMDNYLSHLYNISCIVCTNGNTDLDELRNCNKLKSDIMINTLDVDKMKSLCKINRVKFNKDYNKISDIFRSKYIGFDKNDKEIGY